MFILMGLFSMMVFFAMTQAMDARPSSGYVTNSRRKDGFGAQFQEVIAAVIYAELQNKKFVYTPFKLMEHNYDNDPDFVAKKERLINFLTHFEVNTDPSLAPMADYKTFFDANPIACARSSALRKIRILFRANKNPNDYLDQGRFNIAVHVRRPNPHDSRIVGADIPDETYLFIIHRLRSLYTAGNPVFHLFSQGHGDRFTKYKSPDTVFHLNESVETTFSAMVLADVLVTGATSFSYTAGLLSEGAVYYIPFWHAPLPHWKSVTTLQ